MPEHSNIHVVGTGISCSQINLHKCVSAMEEHNSWMANNVDNTFRISFCQEPYLNTDFKITGFSKDFNLYYVGKPKCRTRACILTTKNVKAWVLNQFSDLDTITIGIKSNNKVYILCSVYMPYACIYPS